MLLLHHFNVFGCNGIRIVMFVCFSVTYILLLFFSRLSLCNCKGSTAENCSEEASRIGKRNVKPINELIGSTKWLTMNNYRDERNASVIFVENTKLI